MLFVHTGMAGMVGAGFGVTGGQQLFTASGPFVVPTGVTSVCAVAIGRGGRATGDGSYSYGGGGGALAYVNAVTVTPGETLTVEIDDAGSRIRRGGAVILDAGAGSGRTSGGVNVGSGYYGGVGGYNDFGNEPITGGGAGGYTSPGGDSAYASGTSLGGAGSSPLGGGPGGAAGGAPGKDGGTYGGGGGVTTFGGTPGSGCVRIIWGAGRAFPSTNTGDV